MKLSIPMLKILVRVDYRDVRVGTEVRHMLE